MINKLKKLKINISGEKELITKFLDLVKSQEFLGYAYDGAEASFELLARRKFSKFKEFYSLENFRVTDEKRQNNDGELNPFSEATVKIFVGNKRIFELFKGSGPINALDNALRNALIQFYPLS